MHIALMAVSAAAAPTGVCRHAANLARDLQSLQGVDRVTLITGIWQAKYFERSFALSGDALRILPINIRNTPFNRNAWYLFQLPALVRAIRADVLHLTFPVPFMRSAMQLPVVLTLHDLYPLDLPQNFGRRAWLNRRALRMALNNADVTVCVSNHTCLGLRQAYPSLDRPAITIPHPITQHEPRGCELLPLELEGKPFLLCIAQHRANKNLLTLVRGFNQALETDVLAPDTRLVIVGHPGPETAALRAEISSLQLLDRVVLLHGLSDSSLVALYRRCELFVAVSVLEGFGLPVAEAIAHGCRVLCSDIPAFHELCDGACTLVPPTAGASQLAIAIAAALTSPYSAHNHSFLTPLQSANRYLAVYQGLLHAKDPRSASTTTSEPLSAGDA